MTIARTPTLLAAPILGLVLSLGACESTPQRSLAELRADGNAHFVHGEYEAALQDYADYLDRKPGATEVRYRMAETLIKLGRAEEAQPQLRAVYDVNPTRLEHAVELSEAMVESDNPGQGLDFLRRYVDSHPTMQGYFALADLAQKAGLPDDALRALKVAENVYGGESAEPHRALARFFAQHDQPDQAARHWRVVLWFEPQDPEAAQELRAMKLVPGPSFALSPTDVD